MYARNRWHEIDLITGSLMGNAPDTGDSLQVSIIHDEELIVEPRGVLDKMQFLIDGESARSGSRVFKHR